ncbi:histidine phosphatase family protein [Yimella sp. cx-51]|uniref:histidine phosphatase family protein n=1 Tax=Yimella sp. cx-51 TaxID=2770551 RepID=UPI00165EAC06|nr:histidine phosphatase family protein [Yimella sp. cx-51]MBC9955723.1 histidine phosphatase family protein [Yimella sp. cx-51]QTH37712.1 histidine phosphatase family protein [Yimella sp. cx-51]
MGLLIVVRHGQASITGADYDQLSDLGERQSTITGAALGTRIAPPDLIVQGGMRRHAQTTDAILRGSRWTSSVETDARWNEFDHDHMLLAAHPDYADRPAMLEKLAAQPNPAKTFQELFLVAVQRWIDGQHDDEYPESFPAFVARVQQAAVELAERPGTTLVSTSGGAVAVLAALSTLGTSEVTPELASAWSRLNEVCVNTGISKFLPGRRPSPTMLSYNDHSHLEIDRSLITYR